MRTTVTHRKSLSHQVVRAVAIGLMSLACAALFATSMAPPGILGGQPSSQGDDGDSCPLDGGDSGGFGCLPAGACGFPASPEAANGCPDSGDDDADLNDGGADSSFQPGGSSVILPHGALPLGGVMSKSNSEPAAYASASRTDGTAVTAFPVFYTGAVAEKVIDFSLPSAGVSWSQIRYYNQSLNDGSGSFSSDPTEQGYNWSYNYWSNLQEDGTDIRYWRDAHHSYTYHFNSVSDNTVVWEADGRIRSRLTRNHTGDDPNSFRLEKPDGTIWLFHSFHSSIAASLRGKLYKIIDVYSNTLTIGRDSSTGRIDVIDDASGHRIVYTHTTIASFSLLTEINVYATSTADAANRIARITYTYKATGTGHADCGSDCDLIQVQVERKATNDTTSMNISDITSYRYFSGNYAANSGNGKDHQLRYIFRPNETHRALTVLANMIDPNNTAASTYASSEFTYYDSGSKAGFVKSEVAHSGPLCCGGGDALRGSYAYDYAFTGSGSPGRNDWYLQTKETRPDGSVRWVETNTLGEVVVSAYFQVDGDPNQPHAFTQFKRDTDSGDTAGRVDRVYTSSAITTYNSSTHALTYDSNGAVLVLEYEGSSKLYRLKQSKLYKYSEVTGTPSSSDGEMITKNEWSTSDAGCTYRQIVVLSKAYDYPTVTVDPNDPNANITQYDYLYWTISSAITERIQVCKITYPTVGTGQNGSGTATQTYLYFDEAGYLRFFKNGRGRVRYYGYDSKSGRWAKRVEDLCSTAGNVDPNLAVTDGNIISWSGDAPQATSGSLLYDFRTTGSSTDFVREVEKRTFDASTRVASHIAPDGQITYVAYLDKEKRVYPSWDGAATRTRLPIHRSRTLYDSTGRRVFSDSADPNTVSGYSNPPTGAETWPSQSNWQSLTKAVYNSDDQVSEVWRWFSIPSSGDGTEPNNYTLTSFKYSTDPNATTRSSIVEVRDPGTGWTKIVRNSLGNVTKVFKTVKSTDPNASDYTLVRTSNYGEATPGSGVSLGGLITSSREYFSTGSTDFTETRFYYDARSRLKLTKSLTGTGTLVPPLTAFNYDNRGRVVAMATYSADPNTGASTDALSTTTGRASLSQTKYDQLGRVYWSETDSIASDGSIDQISSYDKKLATRYFYDQTGMLVAVDVPNGGVQINKPDGAGRIVETWSCSEMEHTAASVYSSGAFDYANSDIKIVEKTILTLNAAGDPNVVEHHEVNHDDPNGMGSGTSDSVATYTLNFYDTAGRMKATAHYGTNTSNWEGASGPSYPGSVPSSSSTVLVTNYAFDNASRVLTVTDPKGIVSGYTYDALGRVLQVTESQGGGGSDLNRATKYTYDALGNVKKIAAASVADYNADTTLDDQTTEYVRGHTLDPSWVTEIHYPDPNTGAASSDPNDQVILTYANDGAVATRTDQIGNVITYGYDGRRRLEKQRVTTLTSPTDGGVQRILYTYNTTGQLQKVTSYTDPNAGTIVNEVALTYDGFGQLTKDEQGHTSAGTTGSGQAVQYGYAHSSHSDESSSDNYFDRLSDIVYPNGRYAWYIYDTHSTTGIGAIDHLLSRVSRIADGTSGGATYSFAEYSFNGLGRMVQRDHLQAGSGSVGKNGNQTALRMIRQGGSGTMYPDFDRFGRITSMRHLGYSGTTVDNTSAVPLAQFNYGYDLNSNRTHAEFANNLSRSHIYGYDNLNRLVSDKLGNPKSDHTDVLADWTKPAEQDWSLDILGNWTQFDRKATTTAAQETRAHNATNEIKTRTPVAEAAKYWIKDALSNASTDIQGWVTAAPVAGSAWSITSSKLQCDTAVALSGVPIGTKGAIYLLDKSSYQDFQLSVSVTLSSTSENGGLVFGYIDEWNFWILVADRGSAQRKFKLYQVTGDSTSGRTWNLRRSSSTGAIGSSGGTFSLRCEIRSGSVEGMGTIGVADYNATIPAGKVGVWAGSDSGTVTFSDFRALNMAAAAEVNGLWYDDAGDTALSSGKLQMNAVTGIGTTSVEKHALRRGFRGSKYVLEFDCPLNGYTGAILHYQDPEDFMAVMFALDEGSNYAPYLLRRKGGVLSTIATGTPFAMASNDRVWCAIHNDPGESALQELKVYVNGTLRLTSTAIDNDWQGGAVGLITRSAAGATNFDNFKVGYDNNADDDCDDGGDTVAISDDFASGTITLAHDNNGNLTDDGVFKYVYDAWNRLVGVKRSQGANTTIAAYVYDGLNRRVSKVVSNTGTGVVNGSDAGGMVGIQAGDKAEDYYYAGWRVVEERNGSGYTTAQTVYGTEYIDEPICRDRNTDVGVSDSDCIDSGGSQRYFYQQDANYRVVALTDESAAVVERYEYEAYGEPRIYSGGTSESGAAMQVSGVGNSLMHQALPRDDETLNAHNRMRDLSVRLGIFMQRDPLEYSASLSLSSYLGSNPFIRLDPLGDMFYYAGGNTDFDWHHFLPQIFKPFFDRIGITDIHNGLLGKIIPSWVHDIIHGAGEYNRLWSNQIKAIEALLNAGKITEAQARKMVANFLVRVMKIYEPILSRYGISLTVRYNVWRYLLPADKKLIITVVQTLEKPVIMNSAREIGVLEAAGRAGSSIFSRLLGAAFLFDALKSDCFGAEPESHQVVGIDDKE